MEPQHPTHPEASLLHGYVQNTLTSTEHQHVEHHLQSCSTCQHELQDVSFIQHAITCAIDERPGPSPTAFSKVMKRIEEEKQAQVQGTPAATHHSWWKSIESGFRSIFAIRWAPALATVLIIGQSALIYSLIEDPKGLWKKATEPIITRGIPKGTLPTSFMNIRVKFQEQTTEKHIRELLKQLNGRIIDGPSSEGLYTLAFPQSTSTSAESLLAILHTHSDIIQMAQPVDP